ncbi:mammalian cell entry protein [Mycobacterium kiyosense]|uniref:Mammalian cell entry protein n=1 Tax=Mycobacterium kiyosense TaxID=2871094 RepID=A0A9P3Q2J0_9MYCO|nr:mammalian cell entry protein [Mycobacterium kiyosense]BDE12275.1 mammalian cell entry protein [Mycobacterium sp. 20KCMC460]GLB85119.1 mammalian cell entry protein [Mycobacterium kiyosense]GLB88513.1 mammalian cell entry protein [Mycobacterium kiyosense]GLB94858.1 mammalian cell entry protein [Mycobacterium kiyosense]
MGTLLVARASGRLERSTDVFVGVPVSAGMITSQSPVRYHGVNVGRIADIESGTETSKVRLAIRDDMLAKIPDSVVARVVPRTFFGDIYLQLVDAGRRSAQPLSRGHQVAMDTGADAMALYDVFTKVVALFSQIKPERMQVALAAISQALRDRGTEIGSMIDDLSDSARVLTPSLTAFLDATPQFRAVLDSLHTATPDIVKTLAAATSVSNRMADDRQNIGRAADALARFAGVFTSFLADHREQLITVVDSAGKILATAGAQPVGLLDTLAGAQAFGAGAARVFATGKFSITAVGTFAGPMPYTEQDCPVYGLSRGAHCAEAGPDGPAPPRSTDPYQLPRADLPVTPFVLPDPHLPADAAGQPGPHVAPSANVVDAEDQSHALTVLQDRLLGGGPSTRPSIATVLMLGPLVRGTEVRLG